MKDGIIIQARTGSTRLHNKILLPFYGEQRIIDILIANIKQACPDKCIILATTNRPQDDVLAEVAHQASSEYAPKRSTFPSPSFTLQYAYVPLFTSLIT